MNGKIKLASNIFGEIFSDLCCNNVLKGKVYNRAWVRHMKYLASCLKENPMDASRNKDDN